MPYKKCFICNTKQLKNGGVTLFSFPKNETVTMWKNFCHLFEKDIVKNLRICHYHFTENDFVESRAFQLGYRKLMLKKGAVPSIYKPKILHKFPLTSTPSVSGKLDINMPTHSGEVVCNVTVIPKEYGPNQSSSDCTISLCEDMELFKEEFILETDDIGENEFQSNCIVEVPLENTYLQETENEELDIASFINVSEIEDDTGAKEYAFPKHRSYVEPRYPGEMEAFDVATPERAHRTLEKLKAVIVRKTREIKTLRQRNRRLCQRVSNMKEILNDLRKKNVSFEELEQLYEKKRRKA